MAWGGNTSIGVRELRSREHNGLDTQVRTARDLQEVFSPSAPRFGETRLTCLPVHCPSR